MGDDGFDFRSPGRREAKRFEPPPWEKEAFEELQRKRAEEEQAAEMLRAHEAAQAVPPSEAESAASAAAQPAEGTVSQVGEVLPAEGKAAPDDESALDEKRVVEMLADLAAQEPKVDAQAWKVALGSAIVSGAIGGVLIVWATAAMAAAARSGSATGRIGGLILLVFGAGFVFGALWLAVRTLRQRGVL